MDRTAVGIVVLVLGGPLANVDGQAKPDTPAEQYQALVKEYHAATYAVAQAKSDEERTKAIEQVDTLPLRFLELAEKNAKDTTAAAARSTGERKRTPRFPGPLP